MPVDLALAAVGFFNRGVEHHLTGLPNVGAGSVALNKWNEWLIWNLKSGGGHLNFAWHSVLH